MTPRDPFPAELAPGQDPVPKGPWRFLKAAAGGGFSRWGLQLLAGWLAFSFLGSGFWALHLRSLTGWSSLPNYWGEILTDRDLWELLGNGGLRQHWTGPWVPAAASLAMLWFLWAGWRLQADRCGLPAGLGPWLWGALDALAIGAPLAVLAALVAWGLHGLGGTGIQGFGWLDWIGGGVVRLAFFSALFLQWWLCRLGRAGQAPGFRLGGWRKLADHLGLGFVRFWRYPLQWFSLILAGVVLRAGLTLLVLALAWHWGGGSVAGVCGFLALQLAVVLINAWLIGWFLRVAALFVRHDAACRPPVS